MLPGAHPVAAARPHVVRIRGRVRWAYGRDQIGGTWMAQCERLRLTCAGDSLPELRVHIAQTLDRLLRQHVAVGSLDAFVREHGWTAPSDGAPPSQATQFYLPCGLIHDVLLGVGH